MDLFLTQLETMPQLMDKRQSAKDLEVMHVFSMSIQDEVKKTPNAVPSSLIPRVVEVIGSGIEDDDVLQSCINILSFLTKLPDVQNNDVLLIENVSTLLCVV